MLAGGVLAIPRPTQAAPAVAPLRRLRLVNAHTGDIKVYQPQAVPTWVDRVMPSDTVNQYLTWWGLYHAALAGGDLFAVTGDGERAIAAVANERATPGLVFYDLKRCLAAVAAVDDET